MRALSFGKFNNVFKNRTPLSCLLLNIRLMFSERNTLTEYPIVDFKYRTHTCGELNTNNIGQEVSLCGWLEFQRLDRFAVLRDGYGSTQIIVPDNKMEIMNKLKNTPLESVVSVSGKVEKRPSSQIKKSLPTGEIEVFVDDFVIINAVRKKLPFSLRNFNKASENIRMKYRYLDLRFPVMQKNLRERSKFISKLRNYLINEENFVEVETPTLFKKTPGGAQEYIVPTKHPGEFYSLVQSPQQLKQLLMVGGIDKYFQIARCYRDEGARPDRQPEFTQLDIEMSFSSAESIMDLIEKMLFYSWPMKLDIPFVRMSYSDAFRLYGTDQPDLSFKCPIFEVSNSHSSDNSLTTKGFKVPQAAEYFNDEIKDFILKVLKDFSVEGRVLKLPKNNFNIDKPDEITFNLEHFGPVELKEQHQVQAGDIFFIAFGEEKKVLQALGKCRMIYLRWLRSKNITGVWESPNKGRFVWITDFPLFESDEGGLLKSVHHPFTSPHPEDFGLLRSNPLQVRGLHYDLVLDGYEVGGGSVRIHDPDIQTQVLSMLNISHKSLDHLLEALKSGAPPHSGIALGLDRLVSLMVGAETIRDVIAFPKTSDGRDPMSGAPTSISRDDLNHYHIFVSDQSKS